LTEAPENSKANLETSKAQLEISNAPSEVSNAHSDLIKSEHESQIEKINAEPSCKSIGECIECREHFTNPSGKINMQNLEIN
jgi:hypothetical protein